VLLLGGGTWALVKALRSDDKGTQVADSGTDSGKDNKDSDEERKKSDGEVKKSADGERKKPDAEVKKPDEVVVKKPDTEVKKADDFVVKKPDKDPPTPEAGKEELPRDKVVRIGKDATALVDCTLRRGRGYGSAFCVHGSGLFITNAHVVDDPGTTAINLVLDPTLKTQRVAAAKVLRIDKENDLALLRAEGVKDLPSLPLGSAGGLTETMEVIAFGFPFGTMLSDNRRDPPAVSVNIGSITSLRRKGDALHRIQVDAALNPGNSGGPVLDRCGNVVGVVVAGIRGAGVNFLIPVNTVAGFLARPEVEFKVPAIERAAMHRPAAFEARAVSVLPSSKPLRLVLVLTDGARERKFPMTLQDGVYRATAVPVPAPEGPLPVKAVVVFDKGPFVGEVVDKRVKVGAKEYKLSELRCIRWQPMAEAILADGKTAPGAITGMDFLDVMVGKESVRLNLASATSARFDLATPATVVACSVVVRQENVEVGRANADLAFAAPISTGTDEGTGTGPITVVEAPALDGEKVIRPLPAPVADAVVGGGGRYLVLHLPKLRKLAVFDVTAAKIAGYIELSGDNVKFGAGLEKLVVVYPDDGLIQRWDLATRQRELTVPLVSKLKVQKLALGSASRGPVFLSASNDVSGYEILFVDLVTLKNLNIPLEGHKAVHADGAAPVRVSADGTVFGLCRPEQSPSYVQTIVLEGTQAKAYAHGDNCGHVDPGPDGGTIYTARGLFTQEAKPIGPADRRREPYCLPAAQGNFYLAINLDRPPGQKPTVAVRLAGDERPLFTLPDVDLPNDINGWDREPFPGDRRVYFIPDAKVLITIPTMTDKLVLHRVDVEQTLQKSGIDYLFVTSRPPAGPRKGDTLTYQLKVKSRKGGVKYRLDSGPKGMEVTKEGLLKWNVPVDFAEAEANVVLSFGDAAGQEIFHTFTLKVRP
jgi:S1-C subfamily serine protease